MPKKIFVTGGARSGKSLFAEELSLGFDSPRCYLATAEALDSEMEERISRHRKRRGESWSTSEEPLLLAETLLSLDGKFSLILIDCITLWLSNLMQENTAKNINSEIAILEKVNELIEVLSEIHTHVIIVSNEVGMGIVPENRMARLFRDIAGEANRLLAEIADEAWLLASGIPVRLK